MEETNENLQKDIEKAILETVRLIEELENLQKGSEE